MKLSKKGMIGLIIFVIISFLGGMQKVYKSIPKTYLLAVESYACSVEAKPTLDIIEPTEQEIEEEPEVIDYCSLVNEEDVKVLGNVLYGEARGLCDTERSAVIWCILNRYDTGKYGKTIISVATAKNQFCGYNAKRVYKTDAAKKLLAECEYIARDVLVRYYMEKDGVEYVGRTLPSTYLYFLGDGKHNYYTETWKSKNYWDWSLESPYTD